jgi:hypothetical protein
MTTLNRAQLQGSRSTLPRVPQESHSRPGSARVREISGSGGGRTLLSAQNGDVLGLRHLHPGGAIGAETRQALLAAVARRLILRCIRISLRSTSRMGPPQPLCASRHSCAIRARQCRVDCKGCLGSRDTSALRCHRQEGGRALDGEAEQLCG